MKHFSRLLLLALILSSLLLCVSCQADNAKQGTYVTITIQNYGDVVMHLREDVAPITCENFASLVRRGFYDGLTFHRIADLTGVGGYIIQGGDPDGNGTGGSSKTIKGEFSSNGVTNNLSHKRGTVSMARSSNSYDSASSQFFFCVGDCTFLDGNYAAFAEVIEGMDILDRISRVTVNSGNAPVTPIIMEKVTLRKEVGFGYGGRFAAVAGFSVLWVIFFVIVRKKVFVPVLEASLTSALSGDKRLRAKLEKTAAPFSSALYLHAKEYIPAKLTTMFSLFHVGFALTLVLAWVTVYNLFLPVVIPSAVMFVATVLLPVIFPKKAEA